MDQEIIHKAALWDALMSCDRIRMWGTGGLGTKGQYMGMEIWDNHPEKYADYGKLTITTFAETIIER